MASSIFFNGRNISVPGSYSEVDASGLDTVGLGASGIIAVLATAEGGRPVSDIAEPKDLTRFTSAEKMRRAFRSGQAHEVGNMLFSPAKDPDILAGAQEVVVMKVNPSTKSAATLQAGGADSVVVSSLDFGAFTGQINIDVGNGTIKGKSITLIFEDVIEAFDDVGGDTLSTLSYLKGTYGYDAMTALVDAAGNVTATGVRTVPGEANLNDNPVTNVVAEVTSDNAGDTTQKVTLFGVSGGLVVLEELPLNGTANIAGTVVWDAGKLLGAWVDGTSAGVVTAQIAPGGLAVFSIPAGAGARGEGVRKVEQGYVNNAAVSLALSAAGTPDVLVYGRNAAGTALREAVTMTGATPKNTVATTYALIDWLVTGAVANGVNLTATAQAAQSVAAVQKTLQQAADYFNARASASLGFVWAITSGLTGFLMANFDSKIATNIADPATLGMTADLFAFVDYLNNNSQLVSAVAAAAATGVPDNTPNAVFLAGGIEGTPSLQNYQDALDLLKQVRVNSVVDLSGNPAVAAAVDAHCAYMGGVGRSERDGFVGLVNATADNVTTKADAKAQIVNINSRHIRAFGQAFERFDAAGVRVEYLPPYLGAIAAGMQSGSPIGTSLTFKNANVLSLRQDPSWNPTDDAEELIQSGLCFLENVPGLGRRVVRNITTHLSSNNLAFIEGSVNEAVNVATFNFRTNMEFAVGRKGFTGTVAAARAVARGTLGLLTDADVLVGSRNLDIELISDVMDVSVELAPVTSVNFVRNTIHLVTLQQLAQA